MAPTDLDKKISGILLSHDNIDRSETMLLTGGLKARLTTRDSVHFYPIWNNGRPSWGQTISTQHFSSFVEAHRMELIGIKQETTSNIGQHWNWAPARECENPPSNNPSIRWNSLSSSILRMRNAGHPFQVVGDTSRTLTDQSVERLSALAKHISIDLHQMNFAIIRIAEHLHNELTSSGPHSRRFTNVRHFDLSAHVHGFFQAYSAARDHFGEFLATQIARKGAKGAVIDDFAKLLRFVDIDSLRSLTIIAKMEERNLIRPVEKKEKNGATVVRFDYCKNTWLHYTNNLRRRFTHKSPYGTQPGEEMMEIYQAKNSPSIYQVKAFLEANDGSGNPDMLRTVNRLYQDLCGFFLASLIFTGYEANPVALTLR